MDTNPLYVRPPSEPPPASTVSELVSYNLFRARKSRGWTQQELGAALGTYTGRAWSNASVSAAERAWQGGRPRRFDADEIAAFCRIFDVPFAYFLLPPEGEHLVVFKPETDPDTPPHLLGIPTVEYLKSILGVDPTADFVDRAQEAVSRTTSLDFIPAKWEAVSTKPLRPAQSQEVALPLTPAKSGQGETAPTQREMEEIAKVLDDAGIREVSAHAYHQTRAEYSMKELLAQLSELGVLKRPDQEEELRELRTRVHRELEELKDLRDQMTEWRELEERTGKPHRPRKRGAGFVAVELKKESNP
ncbi:helix-turn-helix domain-containing protein [Streptomyces sp. NPDC088732]|uniref:helix-turn-helix domain-containing protein n=1 Tax=Streptomyces sp. NPDC088732 TaxID=3365879 RepID=UPI00380A644D